MEVLCSIQTCNQAIISFNYQMLCFLSRFKHSSQFFSPKAPGAVCVDTFMTKCPGRVFHDLGISVQGGDSLAVLYHSTFFIFWALPSFCHSNTVLAIVPKCAVPGAPSPPLRCVHRNWGSPCSACWAQWNLDCPAETVIFIRNGVWMFKAILPPTPPF